MSAITLVTGEQKFIVERKTIEKSTFIRKLLRNLDTEESENENEPRQLDIPVNNISSETLKMVLEWCEHYKDTQFPGGEDDGSAPEESGNVGGLEQNERDDKLTPVDPWDRKFLNVDADTMQSIILAANFLDIKPLLNAACKLVAEMLRGRSAQEIMDAFNAVQ
ncbi:DEKNAAC104439 [Brettanomyces naardenensis]|uniref:E3 ubiquitin ligase complex SCF subunit n=1 Tax=Brettanomyces naardenensis TaxID=13370 RepID=A0A448YQW9_BRENA|nr:DEKNAAC104439 [Brettanomyces naardenensis]